jgi:hypothetical protein
MEKLNIHSELRNRAQENNYKIAYEDVLHPEAANDEFKEKLISNKLNQMQSVLYKRRHFSQEPDFEVNAVILVATSSEKKTRETIFNFNELTIPKLNKEEFRQVYDKGFEATHALFDMLQTTMETLENRVSSA